MGENVSLIDGHIDEAKKTCKDCLHYEACVNEVNRRTAHKEGAEKCKTFKDKTLFVEVVRCKDCKYSRPRNESEKHRYFEGVLICESCEMADEPVAVCFDDFCSYGEI